MENKDFRTLKRIIEYINNIERYCINLKDKDQFAGNSMCSEAVCFDLLQIGELVKDGLSEECKALINTIPWNQIKGLRNRIVHGYDGIDFQIIFETVKNDIPQMKEELQKYIFMENKENIKIIDAIEHPEEVRELFTEYTDMLIENDSSFKEYLSVQNYDDEISHLEHKYGRPDGRLYIVYCEDKLAGCVGLRKLDAENCELKRLYVRPDFRGRHLGRILTELIINEAKKIGYSHMLLDTLPFLKAAIKMYRDFGFYEIPCYNDSPMDSTIFMKLDL